MTELLKFSSHPELKSPTLIIGWNEDVSDLGARVVDYLTKQLDGQPFCEIELTGFYSLGGVVIENNLVQFPENKFYAFPKNDLLVFMSTSPDHEWYKFFNLVLHLAQNHYHVKELYTIGGMISLGAHTAPRQFTGTLNSPELKEALSSYQLTREIDYKTPPGQKPTLNSFFLWTAKRRNIPGANLWVPIPFYLLSVDDPKAQKRVLEFLNHRLDLHLDFTDLDEDTRKQDEKIERMRNEFPDIDQYISKLESNLRLAEGENEKLVKQVEEYLRGTTD